MWCYNTTLVEPGIDRSIARFQHVRVGPYWPSGRQYTKDGYRTLPFPYDRLEIPPFLMRCRWSRSQLLGYIDTWSAVRRCRAKEGANPMNDFRHELSLLWPDADEVREVRWPLHVVAGRSIAQ